MLEVAGRYVSVALSLRSPSLDVIQHPALWSPDFPRTLRPAIACLTQTHLFKGTIRANTSPAHTLTLEVSTRYNGVTNVGIRYYVERMIHVHRSANSPDIAGKLRW